MGKVAALAVIAFGIMATYYSTSTYQGIHESSGEVAELQHETLARLAALTGYNLASQRLAESFASGSFAGSNEYGTYNVSTTVAGSHASIRSVGVVFDADGDSVSYTTLAEFQQAPTAVVPDEPPLFMQYALFTEDDLYLKGNAMGDVYVTGNARSLFNANMHTNHDLRIDGNSVTVKGFGTFTGNGTANPVKALLGSFQPNYNPGGLATARQSPAVAAPDFDITAFMTKIVVDQTDANVTLTGSYDLGGTREDPYVWRITGNLTTTGNTKISGYTLFLVENDIIFSGNMFAGPSGYDGPDESNLAFYSGGGITLGGNVEVAGQFFSQGNITFAHGVPKVIGSITTRGGADFVGTPRIYYRSASPALTTIWQDDELETQLVAYSEW